MWLVGCLYVYWCWRFSYLEGSVGIPFIRLTPPPFCVCAKPGHGFLTSYVVVPCCVQWVMVNKYYSFYWY